MACYIVYRGETVPGKIHVSVASRRVEHDQLFRPLLETIRIGLSGQFSAETYAAYRNAMESLLNVFSQDNGDFSLRAAEGDRTDVDFDASSLLRVTVTDRPHPPTSKGAELAPGGFRSWQAALELVVDRSAGGVVEFEESVSEPGAWPRYGVREPFLGAAVVSRTAEQRANIAELRGRVVGWSDWPEVPACPVEGQVPFVGPTVERAGPALRFREAETYHRRYEIRYGYTIYADDALNLAPRAWPEEGA